MEYIEPTRQAFIDEVAKTALAEFLRASLVSWDDRMIFKDDPKKFAEYAASIAFLFADRMVQIRDAKCREPRT